MKKYLKRIFVVLMLCIYFALLFVVFPLWLAIFFICLIIEQPFSIIKDGKFLCEYDEGLSCSFYNWTDDVMGHIATKLKDMLC